MLCVIGLCYILCILQHFVRRPFSSRTRCRFVFDIDCSSWQSGKDLRVDLRLNVYVVKKNKCYDPFWADWQIWIWIWIIIANLLTHNVADRWLLKDDTEASEVMVSGNEFHSVIVLAAKDFWNWVEAQRGILSLCLVVDPLTGLSQRTRSSWFIGTDTCSSFRILYRKVNLIDLIQVQFRRIQLLITNHSQTQTAASNWRE